MSTDAPPRSIDRVTSYGWGDFAEFRLGEAMHLRTIVHRACAQFRESRGLPPLRPLHLIPGTFVFDDNVGKAAEIANSI